MNRQQAKELLPIIQAFAEGKTIEFRNKSFKEWVEIDNPSFDPTITNYRIKPEPKYRSFKDKEECWNEMQRHHPFGWIKDGVSMYNIITIRQYDIIIHNGARFISHSFNWLFECFTFADGASFGVKKE